METPRMLDIPPQLREMRVTRANVRAAQVECAEGLLTYTALDGEGPVTLSDEVRHEPYGGSGIIAASFMRHGRILAKEAIAGERAKAKTPPQYQLPI